MCQQRVEDTRDYPSLEIEVRNRAVHVVCRITDARLVGSMLRYEEGLSCYEICYLP